MRFRVSFTRIRYHLRDKDSNSDSEAVRPKLADRRLKGVAC